MLKAAEIPNFAIPTKTVMSMSLPISKTNINPIAPIAEIRNARNKLNLAPILKTSAPPITFATISAACDDRVLFIRLPDTFFKLKLKE